MSFAGSMWAWYALRRETPPLCLPWLVAGAAVTLAGSLPLVSFLLEHGARGAGGAWVPGIGEPVRLLSAFTVGLPAIRVYFPDNDNLLLAPLAALPLWLWWLLGLVLAGAGGAGLAAGWQAGNQRRWHALLALLLLLAPAAVAFAYGRLFGLAIWAIKPFVGVVYIFFIWMGIGVSRLPRPLRRSVLAAVLVVALACLVPYFSVWQKARADEALRLLPAAEPATQAVLLQPYWAAPLAAYYLETDLPLWGIHQGREHSLVQASRAALPFASSYTPLPCDATGFQRVTDVWMYSHLPDLRQ
jgi:hypothetical protein